MGIKISKFMAMESHFEGYAYINILGITTVTSRAVSNRPNAVLVSTKIRHSEHSDVFLQSQLLVFKRNLGD